MKQFLALSALTFSGLLATPAFAASSELDIPKVNTVLNEVIRDTFQADDLVKNVFVKFDEQKTVIESTHVRIAGEAGGTVARTPWDLGSATTIAFKIDAEAKNITPEGGLARFAAGLGARTDVMKLSSYLASEILKNASETGDESDNEKRAIEILVALQKTESLDQLHAGLVELHQLLLEEKPEDFRNVTILAQLKNNAVQSITVGYTQKEEAFFGIHDIKLQLKVTAETAQASVKFKAPYLADIAQNVEEAKQALIKLQNRNAEAIAEVKDFIEGLRDLLAGLVEGLDS